MQCSIIIIRLVFKCKIGHKSRTNVASPKSFTTHTGIQHKSGATGRRKRLERIKTKCYGILWKFDVIDRTVSSRRHVVKLLFIITNTILYVEYSSYFCIIILYFYDWLIFRWMEYMTYVCMHVRSSCKLSNASVLLHHYRPVCGIITARDPSHNVKHIKIDFSDLFIRDEKKVRNCLRDLFRPPAVWC